MANGAYTAGLQMLARRELSETQLRQRLQRKEFDAGAIDEAVDRLRAAGSLDDERVAGAIARMETGIRKRGKLRVRRRIEAAGISAVIAQRIVEQTFEEIDGDALLTAALQKRLRGRERIADDREYARLFRYLLGQGFESDRVRAVLARLKPEHDPPRSRTYNR